MNEFSTYEYAVTPKNDRKMKLTKFWLILSYILFPLLFIIVFYMINLPWFIVFVVFATVLFIVTTWRRFVDVEYEYSITSGIVTFAKIFGNRSRKTVMEARIKDALIIAPLNDKIQKSRLDEYQPEVIYSALSSPDAEDGYFMTYEDEEGHACAFLFEATAQTLKICRFYNPSATVISKVRF
ncbi:MAG: hypothetical protein IJY27_07825 [Clostridia bacterium]|nr:hypothetical protein [Clostridia bacterium]